LKYKEQLAEMYTIQNGLNSKSYDTAWIENGKSLKFDYSLAAGQEISEMFNSLPFDWWTGSQEDRRNNITEFVDAWHFIMSQGIIDTDGDVERAIAIACYEYEAFLLEGGVEVSKASTIMHAKRLVNFLYSHTDPEFTAATEVIEQEGGDAQMIVAPSYIRQFFKACAAYNVPLDLLFARYIAKATLNAFRVANGYKVKQYAKLWDFGGDRAPGTKLQEDNFYLSSWIDKAFERGELIDQEAVNLWLRDTYGKIVNDPKRQVAATSDNA